MTEPSFPKSPHAIPDEKTISEFYDLPVLSQDGKSTQSGELVAPKDGVATVIVIFIRHFFCASDQEYIQSLSPHIDPTVLSTLPPPAGPARLVIVGCGHPSRILPYAAETSCEFPIFTDPTRRIHEKLQMKRTLISSTKPAYIKHSLFGLVMISVKQMVQSGFGVFEGGDYSQNGGELIFREGKCVWIHKMESTSDRFEAEELLGVLREFSHNEISDA